MGVSADFEDWTRGLELVVDDMSDFPDWTVAAQVTGGGGGYPSLTGDGQTETPGALVQAGDFTIDGTNNIFQLTDTLVELEGTAGSNIVLTTAVDTGNITLQTSAGTITLETSGTGLITLRVPATSGSISLFTAKSGGGTAADFVVSGTGVNTQVDGQIGNQYGTNVAARGNGSFAITDGKDSLHATVGLYVCAGSPVGVITSQHKGDVVFDVSTPGIWQSTAANSAAAWTQYTLP